MIRVGLLIERMTGRTRQLFEVVALLIGSAAAVYFAWYAFDMNRTSWAFNDLAQGVIAMPLWIPQIGFSGGLIILAVAMVDELVHVLFGGLPRYEKPAPDTPEEAIERAIQSGA
jgi:TRAP-type C4-dicarboxylate transport system permease small subunit